MKPNTAKGLRAAHTPAARRKAGRTLSRIIRYKRKHGIPWRQPLTAAQLAAARGGRAPARRFKAGSRTVTGVLPLDAIAGARPPRPGAQRVARGYVTAARVALAQETVRLVDRLTRNGQAPIASAVLQVVARVLNGAH